MAVWLIAFSDKKGEETHNNEGTDTLLKVICQIKHTPFSFFIFKKREHNIINIVLHKKGTI